MRISIAMAGKHGLLPQTCREWDGPRWHRNATIHPKIASRTLNWMHKSLQEISKNVFMFNWNWSSYISIQICRLALQKNPPAKISLPKKSLNISCWRIQVHTCHQSTFNPQISSTFSEGKEVPLPTLGNQPLLSRRHSWRDSCLEKSQVERVNEPVTNLRNHFPLKKVPQTAEVTSKKTNLATKKRGPHIFLLFFCGTVSVPSRFLLGDFFVSPWQIWTNADWRKVLSGNVTSWMPWSHDWWSN